MKLFLKNSNLCDHNSPTSQTDGRTDGQTDRHTTCDRNTALCTKVHRAVKTAFELLLQIVVSERLVLCSSYDTIRYDTIAEFNVDSKAECVQLNLTHDRKKI